MIRLAHLTDIHLDHLLPRPEVRTAYAEMVAEDSDCCVISGDISTAANPHLLPHFADRYGKPVYFVLGNHDYWGGSFEETENRIRMQCAGIKNLHWLTECGPVEIAPGVQLCGRDGWYDALIGSWKDSDFWMVDWSAIRDFYGMFPDEIVKTCRKRAGIEAVGARLQLEQTTAPSVFFATHVPPYKESAMHEGKPSSRTAVPWYTSKQMGTGLSAWAAANPDRKLTTLCGHVHSPSEHHPEENHVVYCGAAEYGSPSVCQVFEL